MKTIRKPDKRDRCGDCGKRGHSACNGTSGAIADLNTDELDGESEDFD